MCRQLPDGVQEHVPEPRRTVILTLDDVATDVESAIDDQRRTWQRYRNRRRRVLNAHPRLKLLFDNLQLLRRDISETYDTTQRLYTRRCRDVWRTDPELVCQRKSLSRMQRRERRMERSLYDQLREHIGSEP